MTKYRNLLNFHKIDLNNLKTPSQFDLHIQNDFLKTGVNKLLIIKL